MTTKITSTQEQRILERLECLKQQKNWITIYEENTSTLLSIIERIISELSSIIEECLDPHTMLNLLKILEIIRIELEPISYKNQGDKK